MSRFRNIFLPTILLLLLCSFQLKSQDWKSYPYTPEGSLVSFPVDEGWHPDEVIEWWYIAGHLDGTTSGTPYSFMLTYFYYPGDTFGISYDGFRILNVGNDLSGEFHTETMLLNYLDRDTSKMHIDALLLNDVSEFWFHKEEVNGTLIPFEYELSAYSAPASIALSVASKKRPLIPGDDGLFDQGSTSYTYYYSLTDMQVTGTLIFEGSSEEVTGTAWIDRQYGSFNPNTEEAYEWFYLQLSNGMDLNIWNLFTPEKQLPDDPAYKHLSAYVNEDEQYTSHDFELERLAWAKIPNSENNYSQSWRLRSETNQLDLNFSTTHHNSEVLIPFNFFEGPVSATGTVNGSPVTGLGFAELVKTYEVPQLKIIRPGKRWNEDFPIQWELANPDEGRPLLYDLSYSTDEGVGWIPISQGETDTIFYWSNHPFVNGDSCLFRVEAYTEDLSLQGIFEASWYTFYDDLYTHSEHEEATVFQIYPNPVKHVLYVRGNTLSTDADGRNMETFKVIDITGRHMIHGSLETGKVDVSILHKGVYMLVLDTPKESVRYKFIKE